MNPTSGRSQNGYNGTIKCRTALLRERRDSLLVKAPMVAKLPI